MSGFLRPEALAAIRRWRESLFGLAVIVLGYALTDVRGSVFLFWLGVAIMVIGGLVVVAGLQRGRFRKAQDGPGVVQIDEARVTYFGPLDGGVADIDELTSLMLDHRSHPAVWILTQPGQPPLHIPVTASGAEALFDAFMRLPGINVPAMLRKLETPTEMKEVIWARRKAVPARPSLN
ncbi:hypothetical protein [Nioella nitratireducens]|uniref:hypothetical protein n=1 Tax=Nioella nitratireducens TaxID=1287720 RepID=UPI0018F553D3|nr:hypothetical protein [Nioella nitratireducens]